MPKFAANLSLMYIELPFLDRFEAAAQDGFKAVEFLFPSAIAKHELLARLKTNGLRQVLFNGPPGSVAQALRGEFQDPKSRGTGGWPGREQDFRDEMIAREMAMQALAAQAIEHRQRKGVPIPAVMFAIVEAHTFHDLL